MTPEEQSKGRLAGLANLLADLRPGRIAVDYRQAERDAERLAAQLLDRLNTRSFKDWRCVGIPRGGLLVAGWLGYYLDLPEEAFWERPTNDPGRPCLVVDDCALTGYRFGQVLKRLDAETLAFATLYAPAGLGDAIEEREDRVVACVAARLLESKPVASSGDAASTSAGQPAGDSGRYGPGGRQWPWFPWTEPDLVFLNPATGGLESGWRFAPPHRCLKNRRPFGVRPASEADAAALRIADGVAFGRFDGVLWLVADEGERVVSLDAQGQSWLQALLESPGPGEARERLASSAPTLGELEAFGDRLVELGLCTGVGHA